MHRPGVAAAFPRHCHSDVVALLLEHPGIDVNRQGRHGDTALELSSLRGRSQVVRLLLAKPEIDVNIKLEIKIKITIVSRLDRDEVREQVRIEIERELRLRSKVD